MFPWDRFWAPGGIAYSASTLKLVVPVGISFYVFQNIGYLTDVYRRDQTAEKHPGHFARAVFCFSPSCFPGRLKGPETFFPAS